ncbi:hypothetical protein Vretimale_13758 [Volvox reticuliferus]|uniref:Uncharacterized protein n=1 Tax=Volvox reticuliferus TaxID=1737510 RepID=A0A8J4GM04_9CHLO|nr:hypothetical protein Vretifemale_14590 [Volvox reticuliferus]GIM10007.1 hypothetical protein Vretimale_13758 [Volvox reticuliferus]
MDLGFAYKIMRARAPVGYPPAMTASPGEPADPAPATCIPGAPAEQPSELQSQISRPRRSLSAAALTWAPVLVEERSLEIIRKPSAGDSSGAPAAPGYTAGTMEAPSPAPTAPPPAILGPLHLVPRPLVPSARGVTIGPFAEALAAVAARPPRRRPGADASALHLLVGGGSSSSPASPAVSPQPPFSPSPASPPISPPLRSRTFNNPNHQQHHQYQVQGAVQGSQAQVNATAAAPAPGGSKRARRGIVHQQHQQQQQQQLLLLPQVASQKGGHLRQQPQNQQRGSSSPAATVVTASAALSITSLMPSPSAPALSLAMAPALEVEASSQGIQPSGSPRTKEPSAAWRPRSARNTITGATQGAVASGPLPAMGHAVSTRSLAAGNAIEAAAALPPPTGGPANEEWECRQGGPSAVSPGPVSGEADSGRAAASTAAVAGEAEAGRHGEPSHGATDDGTGGHSHHDGVAAAGGGCGAGGGSREAATVQLPSLPMLAMGQSYMGYQGPGGAVSRARTPRQTSSVSMPSASQGGQTHGSQRQQALLQGSGSWRQMMAGEDSAGMLWVAAGGSGGSGGGGGGGGGNGINDPEADAAELDRLEQWVAASQRNPSAVEVAIEQRRALKRLEQLRSRLLRARGASSTGGIWPEPGSGTTHSGSGGSVIPSWVADVALTGRRGSDSLVALASQVSRLPHIDYDQMRDPQYRMKLKARSKQGRLAVLNPVINDELEDMPIRGRPRPWKPLHI